jgi:hypothetical protein
MPRHRPANCACSLFRSSIAKSNLIVKQLQQHQAKPPSQREQKWQIVRAPELYKSRTQRSGIMMASFIT